MRCRALSLLGSLPTAVSAHLVDLAINKRLAFPKPDAPPAPAQGKKKGKRSASEALEATRGAGVNVDDLVIKRLYYFKYQLQSWLRGYQWRLCGH